MLIEMHCHSSEHSACSHVSAVDMVKRAFELGLQGIVLTDHHYLWGEGELSDLRREAGVQDFFLVLSGQETGTSDFGDVLVFGAGGTIDRGTPLSEIRREFPDAAVVWAHPYRNGRVPAPEKLLHPFLNAVEIFSSNQGVADSNRALEDWHRYKFTAVGGTDAHARSYVGTYPTEFDHPFSDIEGFVEEIRAGRCRPYFKEIPKLGTTRTRIRHLRIGPSTREGGREELIVKTYKTEEEWRDAGRTFRILDSLVRKGFDRGPFRVPRPLDRDADKLVLIERAVPGKTLFEAITGGDEENGERYLAMAGKWLAAYHNLELRITRAGEFLEIEPRRLNWYVKDIFRKGHKNRERIREILEAVLQTERDFYGDDPETLVQGHGDFHPKNIFIGHDDPDDPETAYAAVIDFDSSFRLPRAFDVGTFLAQYRNQLQDRPDLLRRFPEDIFVDAYTEAATRLDDDFWTQVELFRARTCLSILYYLFKVGLGDSENFWKVQVEAERSVNHIAIHHF